MTSGDRTPPVYYPALLDLRGKNCVVVGGGAVAARKAASLAKAKAAVTVISPTFCTALARMKSVRRVKRPFRASDLPGAALVIAATDQPRVNERVATLAARRGVLLNVVDQPELCTFVVPSVLTRGPLTIAISTAGEAPALSKRVRQQLQELFPAEYGRFAKALGKVRRKLRGAVIDAGKRQRTLTRLASEEGFRTFRRGGLRGLRKMAGLR